MNIRVQSSQHTHLSVFVPLNHESSMPEKPVGHIDDGPESEDDPI